MDGSHDSLVEAEAVRAAKEYFIQEKFKIDNLGGPHPGYDFSIEKDGMVSAVEVKGRTYEPGFIQFSAKESEQLENNPNFIVAHVLIDKQTIEAKSVTLLTRKDFVRKQVVRNPPVRWYLPNKALARKSLRSSHHSVFTF